MWLSLTGLLGATTVGVVLAMAYPDLLPVGLVEIGFVGGSLLFLTGMQWGHKYAIHKKGKIWARRVFGAMLWIILLLVLLVFLIGGALLMALT